MFIGCEERRLDILAISRNIIETESAMMDLGQTLTDDALSEQLFLAHQKTNGYVTYVMSQDILPRDA